MTKILWHGNSPWSPTGYGGQCALFVPRIAERYDVAISSNYGLEASPITWNGIPVLPGIGQDWGNNTIIQHAEHMFGGDPKGGIVVTLADVWPLEPAMARELNMASWCPVDHDPAPPKVIEFLKQGDVVPIAMSRFGERKLAEEGLEPLYVPHGVDTQALQPMERDEARADVFPQGSFVCGMVAANKGHPSRKSFSLALSAFAQLAKERENVYLYLHTCLGPESHGGESIYALLSRLGVPAERVRAADQYRMLFAPYRPDEMRRIYSMMDILMNPSYGEGFGVPLIEAQSCGIPVLVTDITAMPELLGAGWKVRYHPYWSALNSWQGIPKIDEIYDALVECYEMTSAEREKMAGAARAHALKYDVGRIMEEHWWPTLREVEHRFEARSMPAPITRTRSVAIVTPWHNHPEFRKDFDLAIAVAQPDEVLIMDSGSDPPIEKAAYRFDENVGFLEANNKGLELATADVVVFLNNDISHTRSDWLDVLVKAVEPGIFVSPKLREHVHTNIDGKQYPYLDGWCLAGMRTDFEHLGGWDTAYAEPAYYSDNDLSLRAVACGMRLREVSIGLTHLSNGTSNDDPAKRERVAQANKQIYVQRVRDIERVAA